VRAALRGILRIERCFDPAAPWSDLSAADQNRTNMPNNRPKILVPGATGQVGKSVISHLIAGGESYVKNGVIRHYIGKARWSWVDIEDVAAVAAACLLDPEKHDGQTYRLGYQAATYDEIAAIFTEVIGQPFSYEARPPEEFYRNVLAAGAEPAYMKCVFDSYTELTNGTAVKPDEVFNNLPAIIGRKPRTLADFAKKHADRFRYHLTERIV
jgi:uncharacterized protein YbjT (DUF2867 family)